MDYFGYLDDLVMTTRKFDELFGGPARAPESPITRREMNLAKSVQEVTEEIVLRMGRHARRETGKRFLCMAGGVALNCTANGVIRRSGLFDRVFVQPGAGDDGASLGAALYVQHTREPATKASRMTVPLWGPEFDEADIRRAVDSRQAYTVSDYDDDAAFLRDIAQRIADGQIVAWYQGRMEFGPRALGSRSILADPRRADMRDRINSLVKKREGFRPFAPAVRAEDAARYFDINPGDEATYAHMLYVTPVRPDYRDALPAITHVDGSARAQTVLREHNPRFWALLNEVGALTGMPVVLNTSFNVRGQPIVCTPQEAVDTFLFANLDALAIGNFVLERRRTADGEVEDAEPDTLTASAD
jgi:carbamoyltransferase